MVLFMIGALAGGLIGALSGGAFALHNLHTLRRGLASEMRHDLTDEFDQRFRHIENQLEYLESAIVHLRNELDPANQQRASLPDGASHGTRWVRRSRAGSRRPGRGGLFMPMVTAKQSKTGRRMTQPHERSIDQDPLWVAAD
jgi:hypothetical protein